MTIWIVTIGSSDVQLLPENRSWQKLFRIARNQIGNLQFEPRQLEPDPRKSSLVPSRVMGMVYGEQVLDELAFPLLDSFRSLVRLVAGDRILVLLTDQSQVFELTRYAQDKTSAYWQDTCTLEPILERYFKQHYPNVETSYMLLKPEEGKSGLDDWNDVLGLVQREFGAIVAEAEERVYVSHQAGTPAISSAVQFSSLARFGDRVQFLVSNEFDAEKTRTIESSSYLFNLQKNAALKLLENYDYSAARSLLSPYVKNGKDADSILIRAAFSALVQWNVANFEDFKLGVQKVPGMKGRVESRCKSWWWVAYESAYLGIVRYRQNNFVDALFHTCRAMESLVCDWAVWRYPTHVQFDRETEAPQIKRSIFREVQGYEESLPKATAQFFNDRGYAGLFGKMLYELFEFDRPDDAINPIFESFALHTVNERNQYFHRSLGLNEWGLLRAWLAQDFQKETARKDWIVRVLDCLNLVAGQGFKTFEEASLMVQVHEELVKAIGRTESGR